MLECLQECDDAGERLAVLEMLLLRGRDFGEVFFAADGELGPIKEDLAGLSCVCGQDVYVLSGYDGRNVRWAQVALEVAP